jgi:hypothetical protein
VTIETIAVGAGVVHRVSATVNVGGSLVDVRADTEQVADLAHLVEHLHTKLTDLALETVQHALRERRP